MKIETPFNIEISGLTWVYTPKGILLAQKLNKQHPLFSPDLTKEQQAANILTNNSKDLIEIVLKNGNSILVDPKTTLYTIDGWKAAGELKPEDYVLNNLTVISQNNGSLSIPYSQNLKTNSMPIVVPNKMSPEFAEWLGIMACMGSYTPSNGQVSIFTDDQDLINQFSHLTYSIFKLKPLISKRPKKKQEIYFVSQNVVEFLNTWLGNKSNNRRPPVFLMEGSTEEHLAFISGVAALAKLDHRKNLLIYQGPSKSVADFCSMVLRNSGYVVYQQMVKKESGNYYLVRIMSKIEKALPLNLLNKSLEESIKQDLNLLVPVPKSVLEMQLPYYHSQYMNLYNIKKQNKKFMTFSSLKEMDKSFDSSFYFVKINKINTVKNKTVLIKTLYNSGLIINNIVLGGFY